MDVGVDAFVEEVNDGNPSGRFLAVQIKSGNSHFKGNGKRLSYYASNVHRNYWIGMNIPIILVGYLDKNDKVIWSEINELTLKKTPKAWKIDLSIHNELNQYAKPVLSQILNGKSCKNIEPKNSNYHNGPLEDLQTIQLQTSELSKSRMALETINLAMDESTNKFNAHGDELSKLVAQKRTSKDPAVLKSYKEMGKDLIDFSNIINTQLNIFSTSFGLGISGYDKIIRLKFSLLKNEIEFGKEIDMLRILAEVMQENISITAKLRQTVKKIHPSENILRTGKARLSDSIDNLILEYGVARQFVNGILGNYPRQLTRD